MAEHSRNMALAFKPYRRGNIKPQSEPFLQTKRSPENRQQTQQLLNDLWNEFRRTISKNRKLSPQQLQQVADNQGILLPEEALQRKLVDKVEHFDWVVNELKQLTGRKEKDKSFRKISLSTYARATGNDKSEASGDRIAVIYAEGVIVDGKRKQRRDWRRSPCQRITQAASQQIGQSRCVASQ